MLHLVYRFRLTREARGDLAAFWEWARQREAWFYADMDMVEDTRWFICTIGPEVHTLEHFVTFADETAWGHYRREVARRAENPEWERRRVEQDAWWELLDARLLNDTPISTKDNTRG
jgi:hypothetical protein